MKIQAYIYHKRAEKYSDCQDYFEINTQNNRIAVSDGMSQSIYPQWWAEILVKAYLDKGEIPKSIGELQAYQDVWQDRVQDEIVKRETAGQNPWRLKNAFAEKSGAGATLCGFAWNAKGCKCECIGDSSIIVIYKNYCIEVLSSQEGEFGNHPDYLDSFYYGRGIVKSFEREFDDVMAILLVTDPFSELFQKHLTDKEFIAIRLEEIYSLSDHKSYNELVERWRDDLGMHNDDSTLIVLSDFSNSKYMPMHIDNLENLCRDEARAKDEEKSENNNIEISCARSNKTQSNERKNEAFQIEELHTEEQTIGEFIQSSKRMLNYYNGKRSKNKVFDYLKMYLKSIIIEYCQK